MKVQVFSMEGCGGCEVVKKSLHASNIDFEVVDIFENEELANKYQVRTLPTTVIHPIDKHVAVTVTGSRPQDIQKIKAIVKGEAH